MHALKRALVAIAALSVTAPAAAQQGAYDGQQFVKAIEDGKNDDALKPAFKRTAPRFRR